MNNGVSTRQISWGGSRYGFAGFWFVSLLFAWLVLRLVLFFAFKPPEPDFGEVARALLSGFHRDFFVALVETIPLLFWFLIIPNRRFGSKRHRVLFLGAFVALCYVQVFLLFTEFFFFEEFKSRFNTVAVDYLLYPYEVFVNIWESYHVGVILVI